MTRSKLTASAYLASLPGPVGKLAIRRALTLRRELDRAERYRGEAIILTVKDWDAMVAQIAEADRRLWSEIQDAGLAALTELPSATGSRPKAAAPASKKAKDKE